MLKKSHLIAFVGFFVLYEISTYLSNDMIMPAMLQIVKEFHSSVDNISLSLSLFIVGGSSLQIILGPLCDRFGKKIVLLFGCLWFLFATILIPFSPSMPLFLVARLFQGMGLCFIFIGYAAVHELFNDKQAIKLISLLANITIFAPLLGPLIGSMIVALSDWKYIFIVTGILGLVALIGLFKFMPELDKQQVVGTMKFSSISKIYKEIFTHKIFNLGIWTSAIATAPVIAWIGISPVIVMSGLHLSSGYYVLYQSIIFSGFVLGNLIIQFIAGRVRFASLITVGSYISCGGLIISGIFSFNIHIFIAGMIFYALGFGLFNGSLIRISLVSTGKSYSMSAAAMGLITCVGVAGGLELYNLACDHIGGYTVRTFGALNIIVAIAVLIGAYYFAKINKDLDWQE